MMDQKYLYPIIALICFTIVSLIVIYLLPPIPQWLSYHDFADTRKIWGIPNFWNVVSNIAFCLVGILGFLQLWHKFKLGAFTCWQEAAPFIAIFARVYFSLVSDLLITIGHPTMLA